jgi:hypothetical protein
MRYINIKVIDGAEQIFRAVDTLVQRPLYNKVTYFIMNMHHLMRQNTIGRQPKQLSYPGVRDSA